MAENVALGLKFAGLGPRERRERALDLLGLVGLQDFADAAPMNSLVACVSASASRARSLPIQTFS